MEKKLAEAGFTRSTSYELFILGVSLLSFINLLLIALPFDDQINNVIFAMDKLTACLFFIDFIQRFLGSKNKKHYFFHQYGWSDLIASVPVTAFNIFRVFRVLRLVRALRILGFRTMGKLLRNRIADTALYGVFLCILLLLEFGSISILLAEQHVSGSNIKSASDAMWWVFVSITTVGYGDRYPVTNTGRMIGVLTLTVGVGLFGVVTGYLANLFLGNKHTSS